MVLFRLNLIPNWRHAWRFTSVQLAGVGAFLAIVRTVAQHVTDDPSMDWLTHAQWFAPTMALITALIPLCRVTPQPAIAVTDTTSPAVPPPEGTTMNANFAALFNFAMKAIIGVQQISAAQPTPLSGEDKKAAVVAIAQASVDPADTSSVGHILAMIGPIVAALNAIHPLFQKTPAPTDTRPALNPATGMPLA